MRLLTYQGKAHEVITDRSGLAAGVYVVGLFRVAAPCATSLLVSWHRQKTGVSDHED